jgi:predicted nucleotide-binding protein (sugar kinase/HSP70/actin superfamily)
MPSTQSDGVQSKVMEDLGGSLFVSVETSGDAEANVKSRILMTLYEAKMKAIEEYEMAKAERGLTDDDINKALLRREDIKNPLIKLPHKYVATAANAVLTI